MKFRFKPEDFRNILPSHTNIIAATANHLLDEHLAKCTVVYGVLGKYLAWYRARETEDTHKAILFNIEELVKEACNHEVIGQPFAHVIYCKKCGIKLKPATWEAAE